MAATTDRHNGSRQVVRTLPQLSWATLQQGARPWLWLNGAHSETLQEDVLAISKRFDYRWVWRDTPWEYGCPGYRSGPLLVALDETLYTFALEQWLRHQAGLILLCPDDGDVLVAHLQRLHHLIGADGFPISFSLHAARPLEELVEGLPPARLAELFGPIERLIWHTGDDPWNEWLSADAPVTDFLSWAAEEPLALSPDDETALNQASLAWFMRDCAREMRQRFSAYNHPKNEPVLWRHLNLFVNEATDQLALATERDVRHYVELRFRYSQDRFAKDTALRDILVNRQVQGKQRLIDAEARLATTS